MRIKRLRDKRDMARQYEVYIDGKLSGTLKYGEEKEFDVEDGEHEVYLKIDWCRSPKFNFIEDKNKKTIFEGGCELTGLKIVLAIIYVICKHDQYLFLRKL